jgi:hypothetical protein
MAGQNEFPLALVIKAVDKASAPLAKLGEKIEHLTGPARQLSDRFEKFSKIPGVKMIGERFAAVGSAVGNVGHEVGALALKLLALGTAAGVGLYHVVKGAVEAGDKLNEMAQRVGLNVDTFAALRFAAEQSDVEQEAFNAALDQFNKRLGEAKAGTGGLLEFLKRISPVLANQVKHAKSTESALSMVIDALAKVPDPAKRAAIAAAAFGKSGLQMGQFLGQGSEAIQKLMTQYMRLVGSQEAFAKNSNDLDNAMRETEMAFTGLRNAAFAELFPVFKDLAEMLRDFLAEHREGIAQWARGTAKAIGDWVKGGGIQRITDGFRKFFAVVDPIVQKLGGWPVLIGGIATAILAGPLLGSLASLAAAVVSLGLAIGFTPIGWFLLGLAAIGGAAYLLINNWSGITGFFEDLFAGLKRHFGGFKDFVAGVFTLDLARAWQGIKDIFGGAQDFVATILDGLVNLMKLSLAPILAPLEWGMKLAGLGGMPELPSFRGALGAERAAPQAPGARDSQSKVTVDFLNVPRGLKVLQERITSGSPVDLSVGMSMAMGGP